MKERRRRRGWRRWEKRSFALSDRGARGEENVLEGNSVGCHISLPNIIILIFHIL